MSNTSKMQPIKIFLAKKRNRRLEILFCKQDDDYVFLVKTKRLVDFKKRKITTTNIAYGIETFVALQELFGITIDDVDVAKRINKPLGFSKYTLDIHTHPEIDKY